MQEVRLDTTRVSLRAIPEETLASFREDARFQYEQNLEVASSWWDRLWDRLWDLLFGQYLDDTLQPIWEYLLYAFISLVILYACYRLLGMQFSWFGYRKPSAQPQLEDLDISPHIGNEEWDQRISKALAKSDYREAVRLYFLKALRYLVQQEKIQWQKFKTNQAYSDELRSHGLNTIFSRLVYIYEHVWYGQFEVGPSHVEEVRGHVDHLLRASERVVHEQK